MQWLILDGGAPGDTEVAAAGRLLTDELRGDGREVTCLTLAALDIAPCRGCFGCWLQRPGECLQDDDGHRVAAAFIEADAVVLLTRVTFGGYSWRLKQALDRSICIVSPLFTSTDGVTLHRARYERYPAVLGLGVADRLDETAAVFATLVGRNARNFHAPAHAAEVAVEGEDTERVRERVRALVAAAGSP